jgi:hypothetical protein
MCATWVLPCRAAAPSAPEGYQALPNGDVEAGTGGVGAKGGRAPATGAPSGSIKGPEEEGHSWVALFWEACAYVWPEDR